MSTGRKWQKEIYVGFLLFLLSFLYLSHLTAQLQAIPVKVVAPPNANAEEQTGSDNDLEFS